MQSNVIEIDGKMYLIIGELCYKQDKIEFKLADDNG